MMNTSSMKIHGNWRPVRGKKFQISLVYATRKDSLVTSHQRHTADNGCERLRRQLAKIDPTVVD